MKFMSRLAFAADAPSEMVARRDSFWNGIVLFREQRWAEAYHEFQKARGTEQTKRMRRSIFTF